MDVASSGIDDGEHHGGHRDLVRLKRERERYIPKLTT